MSDHADLIARLRDPVATTWDIEAADTIAALVAERDALARWKSTHAPRIEALQCLKDHAQQEASLGIEARATLESERAANAVLTNELEALRAELDAAVADAQRYRYLRNRAPEVAMNTIGRLAGCWIFCDSDLGDNLILLTGDEADAAIDAARKQD